MSDLSDDALFTHHFGSSSAPVPPEPTRPTDTDPRALVDRLTGYTPGPWSQSHRKGPDGEYRTQVYPTADPDNTIATIHWHSVPIGGGFRTDRPGLASLIAAAPDLHAALTAALDEVEIARRDGVAAFGQEDE